MRSSYGEWLATNHNNTYHSAYQTSVHVTCAMHASPTWTRGKGGNKDLGTLLFRPGVFTGGRELGGDKSYGD